MATTYFKHTGSSATDAETTFEIDHQQQIVRAAQTTGNGKPFFSSTLLIRLAQRLAEEGIDLIVDDEKSWNSQRAPWRLYIRVGAQDFEARFFKLMLDKTVCVELWPCED